MGDLFSIDGITGPGRRTHLVLDDINELGFEFKKKILKVIDRTGNLGTYDLVQIDTIQVTSDGQSFVIKVESKEDETDERVKAATGSPEASGIKSEGSGHAKTGDQRPTK